MRNWAARERAAVVWLHAPASIPSVVTLLVIASWLGDGVLWYLIIGMLPFIGGVFVIEAVSVILQVGSYKLRKKRIFKMAPLHHHFELIGWSESKIIVRFWIASLVFALFALTTLKLR